MEDDDDEGDNDKEEEKMEDDEEDNEGSLDPVQSIKAFKKLVVKTLESN